MAQNGGGHSADLKLTLDKINANCHLLRSQAEVGLLANLFPTNSSTDILETSSKHPGGFMTSSKAIQP